LKRLEEYRTLAASEKWNDVITKLEELLQGKTQLANRERLLVQKSLAYCLHQGVIKELNTALNEYNEDPSVWLEIMKRNEDPTPGFSTTVQAAKQISQGYQYYGSLECLACGRQIHDSYFRWSYKDVPLIICTTCNAKMNAEFEAAKEILRKTVSKAGQDLRRANELDCTNNRIVDTFQTVHKMAEKNGVNLPPLPDTSLLRLQFGMAALPDIIAALGSPRMDLRAAALKALAIYENDASAAAAPLIDSFKSASAEYRREAFLTLTAISKEWHKIESAAKIAPFLAAWLDGKDLKLCELAQLSLVKMGTVAMPDLMRILKSRKLNAQLNAAITLRQIGPAASTAIPALLSAFDRCTRHPVVWDRIGRMISSTAENAPGNEEEMRVKIRSEILHACYVIDPNWLKSPLAPKAVPSLQRMKKSALAREKEIAGKLLAVISSHSG